jgi:hypothetical protein
VKTNQPYGPLAKTLLIKQVDPDPELTTYDDSAWTLGLMTHTEIKPTKDVAVQKVAVELLDSATGDYTVPGKVSGVAVPVVYAVADHGSPNLVTLRYGLKDVAVQIAEKSFTAGGMTFPAGTFLVPASAGSDLKPMAGKLGLDVVGLAASPKVAMHEAALPRLAVYVRSVQGALRFDLQGAGAERRSGQGLRLDPDSEPGAERQGAGGGYSEVGEAAGLPEDREVQVSGGLWEFRRYFGRNGRGWGR